MVSAPPKPISDLAGTPGLRGNTLLLTQQTDLDQDGCGAQEWLVVTEAELVVLVEGEDPAKWQARMRHSLENLSGCRNSAEVGCGYLQVQFHGVWIDVLRYSNRFAEEFQSVARKLDRLVRERVLPMDEDAEARACPHCGEALEPDSETCRCQTSANSLWRTAQLLRPQWRGVLAALLLSLVGVALELVPPWLQKELVDGVLMEGSNNSALPGLSTALLLIVGILAVVRFALAVLSVIKASLASTIGATLTSEMRTLMVKKLQRLSLSFHDHNQVGLLMSRVAYDTEAMHAFMHHLTGGFVLQMVQMIAVGLMLFSLNAKLAMFALMPSPLVLLATWIFCRRFYSRQTRYWDAVGRQAVSLTSLLSGIRVVKSFTQEQRESQRFAATSEQLRDQRIQVDFSTGVFSSLVGFLFALGGLLVWYVGGRGVLEHQMSLGSLMAFLSYLAMFYAPLTTVSEGATWISSFVAASRRIFDLLDTPESGEDGGPPDSLAPVQGRIEFDHVAFSYDGRSPVLQDLCFDVSPGQRVGIVGRSGSGKSTLVGLISRLYEADEGMVRIDGRNVRDFSSGELRRQVGIVLQEPFLFAGTVAANIAYGDPKAPPERIIDSAKAAAAHDFILRLPFGYDTPLGERGSGLSGGERQRVSIARVILYNPRILILDEATSSIDTESERLIQSAIDRFSRGRTTLSIAHRLSTLESADRLLVMDRGRLVETGTHAELLAADGLYARLVQMQFGSRVTVQDDASTDTVNGHSPAEDDLRASVDFDTRWLSPGDIHLDTDANGQLVVFHGQERFTGITVVRAFPASQVEGYLSVRTSDADGRDHEIGLIRNLAEWSTAARELVRRALNRRYLLRIVYRFQSLQENDGVLQCSAMTDDGVVLFAVPNNSQSIKPFGEKGCLITDLTGNHFLIPDRNDLAPAHQRCLVPATALL